MRQKFRALGMVMPRGLLQHQKQQKFVAVMMMLAALTTVVGVVRAQEATSLKPQVLNDGSFKFAAKTSFSCSGRAAGYYADVETGCQIYHMCDGLGRQFSYACPNTTLFQQRMLICDHWYMVNCSKAESNYAANLLIGQRDKPFVPEDENEVRTPRPDLLDSPYSASFAGEPIMYNFIKTNTPAPQNTLNGGGGASSFGTSNRKSHPPHAKAPPTVTKTTFKTTPSAAPSPPPAVAPEIFEESASNHGLPIHWGTRYAKEDEEQVKTSAGSTAIPLNAEEEELQSNKINGRRDVAEDETRDESRNTVRFAVSSSSSSENRTAPVKVPSIRYEPPFTPEEISRKEQVGGGSKETLGAGFKPFESILNFNKKGNRKDYDFSNFFTRNESIRNTVPTTTSTVATSTTVRSVPSTTTRSTTSRPTTTRFSTTTTTVRQPAVVLSDLQPPKANPAQFAPRTGSAFRPVLTTTTTAAPRVLTTTTTTAKPSSLSDPRDSNRPPTTILFNPPAATAGLFENRFAIQRPPVAQPQNVPVPSSEILPPFPNVANYDKIKNRYVSQPVFTRQPITNEPSAGPITSGIDKLQEEPLIQVRKDTVPRPFSVPAPANDLLPPKKDYTYYDDSTTKGPPIYYQWKWSIPSFGLEPPLDAPLTDEEKLLSQLNPADSADATREHNQTARSISSETGNLGENNPEPSSTLNKRKITNPAPTHNYLELRRKLAIPDFTFPLETEPSSTGGRTVYEHDGAVNSFQIKIPAYARSDDDSTAWYGENAKCPECHPAFLRPNSCEPCVKIRR